MARHIRKNDNVIVTAGSDKGRTGRILRVIPGDHPNDTRVVVEGVNIKRKHLRRSEANPQGGVSSVEMPIHASNVSPVVDGKPTRVRFEKRADGSKVRLAVKGGGQIGPELKKAD